MNALWTSQRWSFLKNSENERAAKLTFFICILFALVASLRYLGVLLALFAIAVLWGVKTLRQRRWGGAATACAVVLFDLFLMGPELVVWWNGLGYASMARAALHREIAFVEFQPNIDWPRYRLDDQDRIHRFKSWLLATEQDGPLRSAPPVTVCELKIVYADGDQEIMNISPFLPAIARGPGVRTYVRFYWKDYGRTGDTATLRDILSVDVARELAPN